MKSLNVPVVTFKPFMGISTQVKNHYPLKRLSFALNSNTMPVEHPINLADSINLADPFCLNVQPGSARFNLWNIQLI